jgi:cell shape-determining protein MreC
VSAAADGTIRVEVEDDPAKPTRYVTVTAGLRAEGYVEVTAKSGTLNPGDLVVTGTKGGEVLAGVPGPNDKPGENPTTGIATPTGA